MQSSVQSLNHVWLFATPWTAARQASLSFTDCRSLLKLMCIELVMPSDHLILCCPLLLLPSIFPSIRAFSNVSVLLIRWPNIGVSASASVLPMNIQDWFPLGWTGTSYEMLGWMKHKLKSRLPGEISITSNMEMIPPLHRKQRIKETLDESERGQWESWLKTQHSEK